MASNPLPASMADALNRLWAKYLPEMEARVALIENAAAALASGNLPDAQREAAHGAAHKLAGTLGTFGLHQGTELARKAEDFLIEHRGATDASRLAAWALELKAVIESRR